MDGLYRTRKFKFAVSAAALLAVGGLWADGAPDAVPGKDASPLEWRFPTARGNPHEGMAFADGVTGVLVWGGGDTLKLTVGRADLWDHRGGYSWTEAQSYTNITDSEGRQEKAAGAFRQDRASRRAAQPDHAPARPRGGEDSGSDA